MPATPEPQTATVLHDAPTAELLRQFRRALIVRPNTPILDAEDRLDIWGTLLTAARRKAPTPRQAGGAA
ncbi:hypothetical protein [Pararhodobacter zhoushanensis]|uniref:hypothetical protein n=1 Tax=Pararhodobacter zhoushanensis TaxID=2479545 RepID=UPI000F8E4FA5|nr:hypothetical protein [Pararhodobacter zhoushanensis]